jgi:hypothetical protein
MPKLSGPSRVTTDRSVYTVRGWAEDRRRGSGVEYQIRGERLATGKVRRNGRLAIKVELNMRKTMLKVRAVSPSGKNSRFSRVKIFTDGVQ